MNSYTRWAGRRCDALEDRERASPIAYFGRTMAGHGEETEAGSELGNSLVAVGQANERIAGLQDTLIEQANASWAENLERNLAMMKEYNVCHGPRPLESPPVANCTCLTRPLARSSRTADLPTTPATPSWRRPAVTTTASRRRSAPTRPSSKSPARTSGAACSTSRRLRPTA